MCANFRIAPPKGLLRLISLAIYDYYNENATRYLLHPRTQEIFRRTAIDFMSIKQMQFCIHILNCY